MPVQILIVEDHQPTWELIREYLARDPTLQVVAETADGGEAVTLAKQHHPHIVLMDLVLKGMDGLKATKLLKKACPNTHVVLLTNSRFDDLKERAPAAAFLTKREIPTRLLWVIKDLLKAKKEVAEAKSRSP